MAQQDDPQDPQDNPKKPPFTPRVLDRTVIALPLLDILDKEKKKQIEDPPGSGRWVPFWSDDKERPLHKVVIDVNMQYSGGREAARLRVRELLAQILTTRASAPRPAPLQGIHEAKSRLSDQYLFAALQGSVIEELVRRDTVGDPPGERLPASKRALYRVWPDFPVQALTNKSISTVKADAARNSFAAGGENIVWAVMDSGIDASHPHFKERENLKLPEPLKHLDFTQAEYGVAKQGAADQGAAPQAAPVDGLPTEDDPGALTDPFGHGTHVAGIIAGEVPAGGWQVVASSKHRDETGEITEQTEKLPEISGMAPRCKLVSLRVLDGGGSGEVSSVIVAIETVQRINGYGRRLLIHGVNLSVGYDFEPEWFACGQSPLCVEVDRLVRSGVVVVVAAGNTGYGWQASAFRGTVAAGMDLTINDPGNAELAITVGSTHRDMPHVYGVSYFSSKGPTGDGRMKPDLVAPGEKIISCMSKDMAGGKAADGTAFYREESGTSMAAPHVSGVIAALLSVRREFIGRPEQVKDIFLRSATDLKRAPYFQGKGLVDLMRAIQSI